MYSHIIVWKSWPVIIPSLQMRKRRHGDELSCMASHLTPACSAGDVGSIPGLEWSHGGGNGNPPQYSCLENFMDKGAWRATVYGVIKESDTTEWLTHIRTHIDTSIQLLSAKNEAMQGSLILGSTNPITLLFVWWWKVSCQPGRLKFDPSSWLPSLICPLSCTMF